MPAIWIDSQNPPPLCEHCEGKLDLPVVRIAVIFSAANEIPNELKNGSVNFAKCPSCTHPAWVFSNFLVVDRGTRRAVFCTYDFDSPGVDETLQQRWDCVAPLLTAEERSSIWPRIVWVNDYRTIYEVLCEDEGTYDLDARTDVAYRKRRKLADLHCRAKQFVLDFLETNGAFLRSEEVSPAFVVALKIAFKEKIDACCDARERKNMAEFLALIGTLPQETQNEKTSSFASAAVAFPDARMLDSSRSRQLSDAISQLARLPHDESPTEPDGPDTQLLPDYLDARRWLSGEPLTADDGANGGLVGLRKQLKQCAPHVHMGDQPTPLSSYLDGADWDNNGVIAMLCETAFLHVADAPLFAATLARLLARQSRDCHSQYARFSANALCGDYFAQRGMWRSCLTSFADACLAFDISAPLDFDIPIAGLRLYAVCWQQIGNALGDLGDIPTGLLSMLHAAKVFEYAGDTAGSLRSRMLAISLKTGSPHRTRLVEVELLLADIVRTRDSMKCNSSQEELRKLELECLVALADAQFDMKERAPAVWALRMSKKDASEHSKGNQAEKVLMRFNDAAHSIDENTASVGNAVQRPDGAQQHGSGKVLITEISLDGENFHVAGVQVSGVPWLRTLRHAIAVAAFYQEPRWWYAAYERLITLVHALHPGVTLYFYRLLEMEAREAGMGDIPEQHLITLHIAVAHSQRKLIKRGEPSELNRDDFERLLDLLERDALKPSFLSSTTRVQGFSRKTRHSPLPSALGQRVLPASLLAVAELLEAGGRFSAAVAKLQAYLAYCEDAIRKARHDPIVDVLQQGRTKALYRMARAALKLYRVTGDEQLLVLALNAIEAYRYHQDVSGLTTVKTDSGQSPPAANPQRPVQVHEMSGLFPENCHILVLAVMQETDINTGFWFAALIDPRDGRIRFPRFVEFEQIHHPASNVISAFKEARGKLICSSLNDMPDAALHIDKPLLEALDRIGDALLTPEVVEFLESEHAERLVIVPESYLFDVPFPALRVGKPSERRFLFRLNPRGGTTISVAPNLTHYRRDDRVRRSPSNQIKRVAMTVTLSANPAWRKDLLRLYNTAPRLKRVFAHPSFGGAGESASLDLSARTVHQFLDSLVTSRIAVFFGHGEISDAEGSVLIADDGVVSRHEVRARLQTSRFNTKALILCACSGVAANLSPDSLNKHLAGVHVSMLAGGVRCVIGSLVPTFPQCGIFLLEQLFGVQNDSVAFDRKLLSAYESFATHPRMYSPVFWGHLVGFGDTFLNINDTDQEQS